MADAPIGLEPAGGGNTSTATNNTPAGNNTPSPAEPSVIDANDDTLIRVKGSDKPVKFGDHVRGFQSQFTKASQEAARYKKEVADYKEKVAALERARSQPAQPQNQTPDVFAQLEALPYLDGKHAAEVVRNIGAQIGQRDQVLIAALKQIQQLKGIVGELHGNHTNQSFEAKIGKWVADGGYDPGYTDLAKEIYLAYEGDDLDSEFPQIFKARVEQMEKLFDAKRQAAIRGARKPAFVPGKGAVVGPSKPLEVKADASAREIADMFWNQGWDENET